MFFLLRCVWYLINCCLRLASFLLLTLIVVAYADAAKDAVSERISSLHSEMGDLPLVVSDLVVKQMSLTRLELEEKLRQL